MELLKRFFSATLLAITIYRAAGKTANYKAGHSQENGILSGTLPGQDVEWLLVAGGNTTQVEVVNLEGDDETSCVLAESAPQGPSISDFRKLRKILEPPPRI